MDLATLLGLVGAFAIVMLAMILGGSAGVFFNVPALLIVVVGSLFVVLVKFNVGQFIGAVAVAAKAFMFKMEKLMELE